MADEPFLLTKDQQDFVKLWLTYAFRVLVVVGSIGFVLIGLACMFGPGGFIAGIVFCMIMGITFMVAYDEMKNRKRNEKYK